MRLKITAYDYARGNYRVMAVDDDDKPIGTHGWIDVDTLVGKIVDTDDRNLHSPDLHESCFGLLGGNCHGCEHGITDTSTLQVIKCKLDR